MGVRQGGVLSPKLFSIYVEDIIEEVNKAKGGVKLISQRLNILMYADDIIVMATKKRELQEQLDLIGEFGLANGIKFNPVKCELLVFNKDYKRSMFETLQDDWQEEVKLNGAAIPEVTQFRYLGIIFNEKMNNEAHLEKRRLATFAMINRIKKLGFDGGNMHPKLIGNMFKTYVRPVLMYGCETLDLNESEIDKIAKCEGTAIKRMMGLKKRCYTRHLLNALNIGTSARYIKLMKLKFFLRIKNNRFTSEIVDEWFQINPKSNFKSWLNNELSLTPDFHYDGSQVRVEEKCQCRAAAIDSLNEKNQKEDPVAKKLKLLFKVKDKVKMIRAVEELIHAKNAAKEII